MRLLTPPAWFGVAAMLTLAAWLDPGPASAAEYEIEMLNKSEVGIMVFEPAFLEIAPGDTVHFRAVDKGHNAASIDGMIPEGGATWKGGLSKDVDVTFDVEGVHGIRCVPVAARPASIMPMMGRPRSRRHLRPILVPRTA